MLLWKEPPAWYFSRGVHGQVRFIHLFIQPPEVSAYYKPNTILSTRGMGGTEVVFGVFI